MTKKKKITILTVLAAVIVILIIVLPGCFYEVKEDEYACTARFSKIIRTVDQPGLYVKLPFIDTVRTFPKKTLFYDIPPSEVLTVDKKSMTVDSYILWRIDDPLKFFQSLTQITAAESRLYDITYNAFKTKMGVLDQDDIINMNPGSERNAIYDEIKSEVMSKTDVYGIKVVDVKLKRLDLPESNEQSVYERMISERKREADKYTAEGERDAAYIKAEVDKTVNISLSDAKAQAEQIRAEGEAEYMKLIAEAYDTEDKRDFYEFQLALETLKKSFNGKDKTIILGADNPIAKALTNAAE
ncbi:MAG: protease modulator HflC [Clostridia bacterium]|nr:protease modulator HflC [Clostridia bacterium]